MGKPRSKPRSPRGALIKGMSRRLPREILDSPVFTRRLREIMRGYAGVYALYRKHRIHYVGLTTDLLGRILGHTKDRLAGKWDHFIIFRIQRVRYLKDIETLMHQLLETKGNRVRGRVPRDADINRVLRKVLAEHQHTIRDIERALG
jgi:predicted GIY-YIG superfamily endonuclease